jgi:hypothetical protein
MAAEPGQPDDHMAARAQERGPAHHCSTLGV